MKMVTKRASHNNYVNILYAVRSQFINITENGKVFHIGISTLSLKGLERCIRLYSHNLISRNKVNDIPFSTQCPFTF